MTKRPNSRVNLDKAIMRLFGSYDKSLETRDIMANAIVGQMLCGAVVKAEGIPVDLGCHVDILMAGEVDA